MFTCNPKSFILYVILCLSNFRTALVKQISTLTLKHYGANF